MTLLGPDAVKTVFAAVEAKRKAERLATIRRNQRAYQIRLLVRDGYGVDDLTQAPDGAKPWKLGLSREEARAAVFGRGKL